MDQRSKVGSQLAVGKKVLVALVMVETFLSGVATTSARKGPSSQRTPTQ